MQHHNPHQQVPTTIAYDARGQAYVVPCDPHGNPIPGHTGQPVSAAVSYTHLTLPTKA